jgi:hypothetical protein
VILLGWATLAKMALKIIITSRNGTIRRNIALAFYQQPKHLPIIIWMM